MSVPSIAPPVLLHIPIRADMSPGVRTILNLMHQPVGTWPPTAGPILANMTHSEHNALAIGVSQETTAAEQIDRLRELEAMRVTMGGV